MTLIPNRRKVPPVSTLNIFIFSYMWQDLGPGVSILQRSSSRLGYCWKPAGVMRTWRSRPRRKTRAESNTHGLSSCEWGWTSLMCLSSSTGLRIQWQSLAMAVPPWSLLDPQQNPSLYLERLLVHLQTSVSAFPFTVYKHLHPTCLGNSGQGKSEKDKYRMISLICGI